VLWTTNLVSQPTPPPAPKPGFRGSDTEDREFGPNFRRKMQELVTQGFLARTLTPRELAYAHFFGNGEEDWCHRIRPYATQEGQRARRF